jgi:hypothetical protein
MSVAPLERPVSQSTTVTRTRTQIRRAPKPQTGPQLDVRVRILERRRSAAAVQAWSLRAVAFLGVFSATYVGSALMGQVAVESARRQEIAAKERAVEAVRTESALSDKVFALNSASYVEGWAAAHRFVAPDAVEALDKSAKTSHAKAPDTDLKRYVASR